MKSYWKIIIIRLWNNRTGTAFTGCPPFFVLSLSSFMATSPCRMSGYHLCLLPLSSRCNVRIGKLSASADGFNGYTITEANERGKTMPGHVEGQMTSQFALFFYHLQAAAQTAGCRYEEKFSVLSLSLVFVDNATWNIE